MNFLQQKNQHLELYELFKTKGTISEESKVLVEAKTHYVKAVEHLIMAIQLETDQNKKKIYEERAKIILSHTERIKQRIEKNKPKTITTTKTVFKINNLKKEKKMETRLSKIRENAYINSKVLGKPIDRCQKTPNKKQKKQKKQKKSKVQKNQKINKHTSYSQPQIQGNNNYNYQYQQLRQKQQPQQQLQQQQYYKQQQQQQQQQQMLFNQTNQNQKFNNQTYFPQNQNMNTLKNNSNQSAEISHHNNSNFNYNFSGQSNSHTLNNNQPLIPSFQNPYQQDQKSNVGKFNKYNSFN
ncbi:argonaut-like protein [Anaeramoeba flamelloides]|uniref:Argonaut-like protein n=1 Tax=Anaeramoeba flamelloides TaxID=1746091 RepID=A0ABQ8Y367_9EUKA|nr:argonaut-like protein [Anaeramoeba flamelloides]